MGRKAKAGSGRCGGRQALCTVAALAGCLCLVPAQARQSAGVNQGGPDYVHTQAGSNPVSQGSGAKGVSTVDQMRMAEQRRRILADTVKLVELSNQLKAEVEKAPGDQLSVDVLRKAGEIEKTAHDLKGWMRL